MPQPTFLRASDFCRRPDTQATSAFQLPVRIKILPKDTISSKIQASIGNLNTKAAAFFGKGIIQTNDFHNVALIAPQSTGIILKGLSLLYGSLVVLNYKKSNPDASEHGSSVTVILLTCPPDAAVASSTECPTTEQKKAATEKSDSNNDNVLPTVFISATVAATLGCAWGGTCRALSAVKCNPSERSNMHTTCIAGYLEEYISPHLQVEKLLFPSWIQSQDGQILPASHVTLNCLGYPVPLATATSIVWPRPSEGILFSKQAILQIQDPIAHLDVYYEVVEVQPQLTKETTLSSSTVDAGPAALSSSSGEARHHHACYMTALETVYTYLNSSHSGAPKRKDSRRLPPLDPLPHSRVKDSTLKEYPHPGLPALVRALRGIPATDATPQERVIALVGTDTEHDVRRLVQVASHSIGMRHLSVVGLAAFAADNGHSVSTGSLSDQLEGLQIALEQARRCSPCVLHVVDLDLEFASDQHDPSFRDEQENLVWSILMDALDTTLYHQPSPSTASMDPSAPDDRDDNITRDNATGSPAWSSHYDIQFESDWRRSPSLLVVISTSRYLTKTVSPGPLLQNLTYAAMSLSSPDAEFVSFLWGELGNNQAPSTNLCDSDHDKVDRAFVSSIQDLLVARNIHDIRLIHERWMSRHDASKSLQEQREAFGCLCQDVDRERHGQSPSKSSSQVKVANVKWDDVGGLSEVRREILDTIELPLRYPHFFSNGGRSGILLYGPPGSGKTLVATALATECSIPFLSVKGPELLGSYVGECEANVRGVFAKAREAAFSSGVTGSGVAQQSNLDEPKMPRPKACLVFFDELDSLAPRRDDTASGGGVMDRVVATLAAELDKGKHHGSTQWGSHQAHKKEDGCYIFVLGATNRPDLLDAALLRSGRFDRKVYLGVASAPKDRAHILAAQTRHLKFEQGRTPLEVAESVVHRLPNNLTGADLSSIGSDALSLATRRLCGEADREARQLISQCGDEEEEREILDEVLSEWNDCRLVPVVAVDDMLAAAREIIPSVSKEDWERYERLRLQFASTY